MSTSTSSAGSLPAPADPAGHGHLAAGGGLDRRTLTVPSLVFLIIAASAPLTVLAGGVPSTYAVTGLLGVPLGFLLLGAILALFAVGYGAMSARITNAGAFYAYVADGLGHRQGIGASWLALISYNAMQIGLYGIFGFVVSSFLEARLGLAVPWWAAALAGLVLVGLLGVSRVDLSAKVIAVLVTLEFLVVVVVDAVSLAVAPEGLSAQPLMPSEFFTYGIGAVLSFGIAAFMGFESAAIYSEEAKDPARAVPRATFTAVAIISVFYAVSAWALAVGVGPGQVVAASREHGPDLVFVFLGEHGGALLTDIAQVLFVTSLLAALIAFHNAVARYFFSLGRESVLPSWLGAVGRRNHAPVAGSLAQSALAVVLVTVFAVAGQDSELGPLFPVLTLFTWLVNAGAFGLIFLLAVTSLAVIGHFRRDPGGHSAWVRWAAPALSAAGLGVVFVLVLVNFDVLIGAEGPSPLAVVIPGIVLAAGVAGLAWGEHLRRHRPEVFAGVGSGRAVESGGPVPDPRPGPSSGGAGEPELAGEQR
ncbi:amino acid permease [Kocuria dechangensis]|uniref:Amino acid permease n=1 Tax=Kocuria dechangensis TaxID=1176249 RepID=A0A917GIJ9_9MICC|nr:APC family permease [Kocuria dechangensis]GGG46846.1 amino acid permease [Kocuria dechangensis]